MRHMRFQSHTRRFGPRPAMANRSQGGAEGRRPTRFRGLGLAVVLLLGLSVLLPGAALAAPVPGVTLDVPPSPFIGEPLVFPPDHEPSTFTVTFDNTGPDTGYGPYIDVFLPFSGADGQNPPAHDDGISFVSANYLGAPVTTNVLDCPAGGNVTHPLTGQTITCPAQPVGLFSPFVWQLVVITLPFGSFVPDQPPAPVTVNTNLSNYADLGVALPIQARSGFMFGADPLDNPATDPPIQGDIVSETVTPSLITLRKIYHGPEDETATGPNFPRQYTIAIDIALGQTVANLDVTDNLPNNMQFTSLISTNPGATCTLPSTSTPGGTLTCTFASVTGGAGDTDATVTFEYYIPLRDANSASVINPVSGDDVTSCNDASALGDWDPLDPRDSGATDNASADPAGCEHILTDKSIAIQKTSDVGEGGYIVPHQVVTYTHDFQVSDFFAFKSVVVTDTISDGQHVDSSFTPTLQVNGNTYTLAGTGFASANYDVICNYTGGPGPECKGDDPAVNNGATTLTFRVSDEIITRGQDGRLIGGCVPTDGAGGSDPNCGAYNNGPTTGRIVYRTVVQENFTDDYPSMDTSVDQGDRLDNNVTVNGNLLSTSNASTPTGQSESDTSYEWVWVPYGTFDKSIYAIDGNTSFPTPVHIKPGDTVTYRLTHTMPTSDFENVTFTDYLPLPVFHAAEVTAFSNTVCGIPTAGNSCLGPDDDYHSLPSAVSPTLDTDGPGNWVRWTYGDYDSDNAPPSVIDLLFTVTVSNDPFADGLYLTNQGTFHEGSTNFAAEDCTGIIQIQLDEPVVAIHSKGVVWTNNPTGVFSPSTVGPVPFDGTTGSCAGRLGGGTVTSSGLAASPVNSNLSNVDAGDTVMMAIVLENIGHYYAYDVQVRDSLPPGVTLVPGSLLCVTDGTGADFATTDLGGGLFGNGIELVDPGPTPSPPGALDPGQDSNNNVIDNGRNIAVVTYLVTLDDSVAPAQVLTNTATLLNFTNHEGGDNFIPGGRTDTAQVTVQNVLASKSLISTEISNAANADDQAVIGELVTYQVTLTIPEGVTPNAILVDTLDSGLAFVDLDPANPPVLSPSLSITGSTTPGISSGGQVVTFDFGTVTNSDTNNATPETITLTYRAVVLNIASNQAGMQLNNSAVFSWAGNSLPAVSAPSVTVIEPTVNTAKTAAPTSGDAADTITFTVTLSNPAGAGQTLPARRPSPPAADSSSQASPATSPSRPRWIVLSLPARPSPTPPRRAGPPYPVQSATAHRTTPPPTSAPAKTACWGLAPWTTTAPRTRQRSRSTPRRSSPSLPLPKPAPIRRAAPSAWSSARSCVIACKSSGRKAQPSTPCCTITCRPACNS
ncbi:MAG: hypothetical protein CVU38_14565 [Chloroflexi bacterium HGW-Chloroflexi-1]|nr:MAG: hypothetical protein CVU38_14565 [Chloroflexi bacterium HGW-Chloroflexi-1]